MLLAAMKGPVSVKRDDDGPIDEDTVVRCRRVVYTTVVEVIRVLRRFHQISSDFIDFDRMNHASSLNNQSRKMKKKRANDSYDVVARTSQ